MLDVIKFVVSVYVSNHIPKVWITRNAYFWLISARPVQFEEFSQFPLVVLGSFLSAEFRSFSSRLFLLSCLC